MERVPVVSICLTTYNRGKVLSKTIDSILSQSFNDFELIISDDNSTDNTEAICHDYLRRDNRVRYFRNVVNLRMPGNLNAAIEKTRGEYIANLHDGDVYDQTLIEKWFEILKSHPDCSFVFNQYRMLDAEGKFLYDIDHGLDEVNAGIEIRKYFYKTFSSCPWGTVMARKSFYKEHGLFNPEFEFISDVEMWLRLSKLGKVGYVKEPIIELTPREKYHKYFLPHWRITYLNQSILKMYFEQEDGEPVSQRIIRKNLKSHLLRSVLVLLKHRSFNRVREFIFLIKQSPFLDLKIVTCPFLLLAKKPENFNAKRWEQACELG